MLESTTVTPTSTVSTVEPAELERYNALAATWWDPAGPMWPLHRLNAVRVPFIEACLRAFPPGYATPQEAADRPSATSTMAAANIASLNLSSVSADATSSATYPTHDLAGLTILDIGCGAGLLSEAMAKRGAAVTGVDPATRNIGIARQHARQQKLDIDYQLGTVETLPPGQFDVVLNMEVVEHVAQLELFMQQCNDRVAPAGVHFVATINRNLISYVSAIVGAEYILRWLPKGTHQWRKFVKPAETEALLAKAGLDVLARGGVAVNPLNRSYRLTDSEAINYMLMAKRR